MRCLALTALLLAGACAQPAPIPVTYVPQAPTPAAAGTPEQQAARRLDRAMGQQSRDDRLRAGGRPTADDATPGANLEIGGGDAPEAAPQVAIPFR